MLDALKVRVPARQRIPHDGQGRNKTKGDHLQTQALVHLGDENGAHGILKPIRGPVLGPVGVRIHGSPIPAAILVAGRGANGIMERCHDMISAVGDGRKVFSGEGGSVFLVVGAWCGCTRRLYCRAGYETTRMLDIYSK